MLTNKTCSRSQLSKSEWQEFRKPVWDIPCILNPRRQDHQNHSAVYPEELAKRLIKMYSFVNDIVLDPFVGSGTTLRAAKELERKWVGYELYENYRRVIEEKLNDSL